LSVNRLADAMAFAHAGMTAEGDNKVLIQKVTKELITDLGTGKTENPEMTIDEEDLAKKEKIDDLEVLRNLVNFKQMMLTGELMENMRLKILEQKQ